MKHTQASWLPSSKVKRTNITPSAWFEYDFAKALLAFRARASHDSKGGGAGPNSFFFVSLGHGRVVEFSSWAKRPGMIELSLRVNARGVVYWEDLEDAIAPLSIAVAEVHRQGAFNWRRRNPQRAPGTQKQASGGIAKPQDAA